LEIEKGGVFVKAEGVNSNWSISKDYKSEKDSPIHITTSISDALKQYKDIAAPGGKSIPRKTSLQRLLYEVNPSESQEIKETCDFYLSGKSTISLKGADLHNFAYENAVTECLEGQHPGKFGRFNINKPERLKRYPDV
jgi:hypothetical protein